MDTELSFLGPVALVDFMKFYFPSHKVSVTGMPENVSCTEIPTPDLEDDELTQLDIGMNVIECLNEFFPDYGLSFCPSDDPDDPNFYGVPSYDVPESSPHTSTTALLFIHPSICTDTNIVRPSKFLEMASTARDIFSNQWRNFLYGIYVGATKARICRFDGYGITISTAFSYTDTMGIQIFLWRFIHVSSEMQGVDTSVYTPTPPEIEMAKIHLSHWGCSIDEESGEVIESERDVVGVHVPCAMNPNVARNVLAWMPIYQSEFTGSCTKIIPVYDPHDQRVYCLKDSWRRADGNPNAKEEVVLQALDRKDVPFIPRIIRGGEIISGPFRTTQLISSPCQNSTDAFWDLRHYRHVTEEVLELASEFVCSRDLVAIFDQCLQAHNKALLTGILYRNVRPEHIMISPRTGDAVLVGWDKTIRKTKSQSETANILLIASGDLFKFVRSLIYMTFRYVHNSHSECTPDMLYVLEQSSTNSFIHDYFSSDARFSFIGNPNLTTLLYDLVAHCEPRNGRKVSSLSYKDFRGVFLRALGKDGWPMDDCSLDFLDEGVRKLLEDVKREESIKELEVVSPEIQKWNVGLLEFKEQPGLDGRCETDSE